MEVKEVYKNHNDSQGSQDLWWVGKGRGGGVEVMRIEYHSPQGEGDAHYCDVIMSDGCERRIFRPDTVDFIPSEKRL